MLAMDESLSNRLVRAGEEKLELVLAVVVVVSVVRLLSVLSKPIADAYGIFKLDTDETTFCTIELTTWPAPSSSSSVLDVSEEIDETQEVTAS